MEHNMEMAMKYLKKGFSVIPVNAEKEPLLNTWQEYQTRFPTEQEIKYWFSQYPDCGIAVVTGRISNLIVLDLDVKGDTDRFPATVIARSGKGGLHYYFRYPQNCRHIPNSVKTVYPDTDVRGDGGLIVLPPSVSIFGQYEWIYSPFDYIMTELPAENLNDILQDKPQAEGDNSSNKNNDWNGILTKVYCEGERNHALTKVIGKWLTQIKQEAWDTLAWDHIIKWSEEHLSPKLPLKEVKTVFESIKKAEKAKRYKNKQIHELKIDPSIFQPMLIEELDKILGLTIKQDNINKIITFLSMLLCYTEDAQINLSYNAPSSAGKSFIPTEIAKLFPKEDIIDVGHCSPTAFFHDRWEFDPATKAHIVDLSKKIIIFLDQPNSYLLGYLRSLLSHDKKTINIKITDKNQKSGLRTKDITLKGFPSVIFCSAGMRMDEQECTRFLLLSPEISQGKLRESVHERIKKEVNKNEYYSAVINNPQRQLLCKRVLSIRQQNINDVIIEDSDAIEEMFLHQQKMLKPKDQRDVQRFISIIKSFTLLNFPFRRRVNNDLIALKEDIENAIYIWSEINDSQEYNVPPYILELYKEVILPAFISKAQSGITIKEFMNAHYQKYNKHLEDWRIKQDILPMLESGGLIRLDECPNDRRKVIIFPLVSYKLQVIKENDAA